jgi:hypothetical protein
LWCYWDVLKIIADNQSSVAINLHEF